MKKKWTEEDILKVLDIIRTLDVVSFSTPISSNPEQDDTELGDFILDNKPGPQEIAEASDLRRLLNEAVTQLNPREQRVIQLRYGLLDGKFRTLDEIAELYGVCRQRIEQVEKKGLKRLNWLLKVKYKLKRENL